MAMHRNSDWDKLSEECGIFGIYGAGYENISSSIYYGLTALQHRGQESAGIAAERDGKMRFHKKMGLVREVFDESILEKMEGDVAIGHVRYSTSGESYEINAQPLVVNYRKKSIALAHNGNLINAKSLREELEEKGSIFQTSTDSEVIAYLMARNYRLGLKEAVKATAGQIEGAFALLIICEGKLIGVRDPNGLRPLSVGVMEDGEYVLSSESCAFDLVGARFLRDVLPGEMVIIDENGLESVVYDKRYTKSLCSFEFVYFARPDSVIDGKSVYMSRIEAGKILAKEHPAVADIVMAVPDSGSVAALGYSQESGIPYAQGLIKNKYLGRTFIQPNQKLREQAVKLKLSVVKEVVEGKSVVLVDDSIVRGTTSARIVAMLKDAGAREIHFRVSSPPVTHSCYFGIDTPDERQLVGAVHSLESVKEIIGVDSLGYISPGGLMESIGMDRSGLCGACFSGNYPMEVPSSGGKFLFEKN